MDDIEINQRRDKSRLYKSIYFVRVLVIFFSLCLLWESVVYFFHLPDYILPSPLNVFTTLIQQYPLILSQSLPTIIETLMGLSLGSLFGIFCALSMIYFKPLKHWFLPVLLISQSLPTFAIAPLLVVWFGYGMSAKIITTMIMLFFPVANAFYDGLNSTKLGWLDLAQTMNASKWQTLWRIRIPAALPSLATGLRVATAIAPIGAVVSEWVGASQGLGFLMLNANARMQINLMFAALFAITLFTIVLYSTVDKALKHFIPWSNK